MFQRTGNSTDILENITEYGENEQGTQKEPSTGDRTGNSTESREHRTRTGNSTESRENRTEYEEKNREPHRDQETKNRVRGKDQGTAQRSGNT